MNTSELETLCRRIAPGDIAGHPVYVCFASEMPQPLRPSPATWGYTGPALDLAIHHWLSDSGRWRGRGIAIVINDIAINEDVSTLAGNDADFRNDLYATRILATVLHELAHALSMKLDFKPLPVEVAEEIEAKALATTTTWVATSDEHTAELSGPAWLGHEAGFIRALLHVIQRAYRAGIERLPDNLLFVSEHYSLSQLWNYRRALEPEIEAFGQPLTFHDLRQCRPTESFIELWKKDLHDWVDAQSDELAILDMVAALRPYIHAAG